MPDRFVLVDADVIGRRRTGDESYLASLLAAISRENHGLRLAAVARDPKVLPAGVEPVILTGRSRAARLAWRLGRLVRRLRPDLVHCHYVIPAGCKVPAALTVHDLSFEDHPEFYAPHYRLAFKTLVPPSARRADMILTCSEWSKSRIVDRYGVAAERVVVGYGGVDPAFTPDGAAAPGDYLLFVGALQPRKDPASAVEALAILGGDLRLVFAGPEQRDMDPLRRLIAERGLERRVEFTGYVDRQTLVELYRGAACFVFPSRYEGFGLPVLEAMACGAPVVAAATTSIPEVVGDAGILVPPADPEALADGIRSALGDRARMSAAGIERAGRFTWEETAKRTLEGYRHVLDAGG